MAAAGEGTVRRLVAQVRRSNDAPRDVSCRFDALYRQNREPVMAFALRRVGDRHVAEDVVTDVFVVLWRRADDVPPGDEARRWLYGVARHVIGNHHRAARRHARLVARLFETSRRLATSPEESFEHVDVLQALGRLSPEDREVLRLSAWEELSYAEIGAALNLSPAAVTSRIHRARRRLENAMSVEDRGNNGISVEGRASA